MANLIEIKNIHHQVNSSFSIDLDQLYFQDGPIYALTGESGAGKSTLLKILGLITRVEKGKIKVFDAEVLRHRDLVNHRRRIGFLNQCPYLFRGTVFQNVALGLEFRGEEPKHIKSRVSKLLKEFNFLNYAETLVNSLSEGQKQLTAILRALAPHPEILMLDEPTNNLDYDQHNQLLDYLYMLNDSRGTMIVIATKSREVIDRLANISIHLRYGKVMRILTGKHQISATKDAGLRS